MTDRLKTSKGMKANL